MAGAAPQITIIHAESDQADVALNLLARFLAEERFDTLAGQLHVNLLGIMHDATSRVTPRCGPPNSV